ncbi:hypothetical protein BOTBODRAFT_46061 [Botryobasidium botryosum FD-172 SS1]|uniref:Uncharacterized protein n=1 Tax=Botryobasidium botryosum (strain FD-172 SS1) TaxID=930990 RepID=A0A067MK91_BOTB1|nr:hypothetical protein BOTBODRAFT_46061 [Botryobasidium botryosum FD-172 SS1]
MSNSHGDRRPVSLLEVAAISAQSQRQNRHTVATSFPTLELAGSPPLSTPSDAASETGSFVTAYDTAPNAYSTADAPDPGHPFTTLWDDNLALTAAQAAPHPESKPLGTPYLRAVNTGRFKVPSREPSRSGLHRNQRWIPRTRKEDVKNMPGARMNPVQIKTIFQPPKIYISSNQSAASSVSKALPLVPEGGHVPLSSSKSPKRPQILQPHAGPQDKVLIKLRELSQDEDKASPPSVGGEDAADALLGTSQGSPQARIRRGAPPPALYRESSGLRDYLRQRISARSQESAEHSPSARYRRIPAPSVQGESHELSNIPTSPGGVRIGRPHALPRASDAGTPRSLGAALPNREQRNPIGEAWRMVTRRFLCR